MTGGARLAQAVSKSISDTVHQMFTIDFIQAVNDWQRGGSPKQKARRAERLKASASQLPALFRVVAGQCFRQLALTKRHIWTLHEKLLLDEAISSWSLSLDATKVFKNGVPPPGTQGVIFAIVPTAEQVIVNLDTLYRDDGFREACARTRAQIRGYSYGIGQYGNSQSEVVLELPSVSVTHVYALGGYSGSLAEVAELHFGHLPNETEMARFKELVADAGVNLGPDWISGAVKDRVLRKTFEAYARLAADRVQSSRFGTDSSR